MAVLQFGIFGVAWVDLALAEERPVGFAGKSLLVAHPSAAGSAVAEHHGVGLYAVEHLEDAWIVVVVLAVDGALVACSAVVAVAAVSSVEPHLEHLAVVGEEVAQLGVEIGQIGGCGVVGARAVPGREVYGKLESVFLACFGEFLHHVALASAPGRLAHVVVVAGEGP